ncbi:hypothetical protein C3L33_00282, partial [Rhododendron williamsianum]
MGINSNRVEHYSDATSHETTVTICSAEAMPNLEVHKVCLPPHKTTLQKLRHRLSEIFFPDDPLHRFKNQTWLKKFLLGLQFFFPVFQWGPNYSLKLLRSDVISGLTIASLAIPQGISYAKLANLPPIIGLYSSFVPPLIYSVLGSSRHIGVGPVSIASLVMGTMLSETVSYADQPILYLQLAFTATFFAGVFQASLGLLRLGFVIDFLSKATLVGFMAGAAVIVSLQQLKGLLGIVHFTSKMEIVPVLSSVFMVMANYCHGDQFSGVSVSNKANNWALTKGSESTFIKHAVFSRRLFGGCTQNWHVTGILALTEGIAVGRTFAALKNYQVDGNKEMMAIGLMNMAGSCSSCYITTGLAIAVGVSVFKILLHVTRPNTMVLGNIPGTQIYQDISRYREALRVPSFLIVAVESPFFFANSTYLQERILRWFVLANPVGNVMEKLHQSNALESFGLNGLYLSVGEAVADISSPWKAEP